MFTSLRSVWSPLRFRLSPTRNHLCPMWLPGQNILAHRARATVQRALPSTSLQDFWARRWNLVVSGILRLAVYDLVHCVTMRALGAWARVLARLATFLVSGLLHEVFYYYITRVRPTWEVMWFFVLHGFFAAGEVAVKRKVRGRWRPGRAVSVMLTVAFVAVTVDCLLLPQLTRNGVVEKIVREYSMMASFMCNKT